MKRNLLFFILLLCTAWQVLGQITAVGASHRALSDFASVGSEQDSVFFFCESSPITLRADVNAGSNYSFIWYVYDASSLSYTSFYIESGTSSSTTNLSPGGYKVEIFDQYGEFIACDNVWVFYNSIQHTGIDELENNCSNLRLQAKEPLAQQHQIVQAKPSFLIDQDTEIEICLDIEHPEVFQLGFVLYGPASCGSPSIILALDPEAENFGGVGCSVPVQNTDNLCFNSKTGSVYPDNCAGFLHPHSGVYEWRDAPQGFVPPIPGLSTTISTYPSNTTLNGCEASDAGWTLQVYDAQNDALNGVLKNVSLRITSSDIVCGAKTILYESGPIHESFSFGDQPSTAFTYEIPQNAFVSETQEFEDNFSYTWTSNNPDVVISNPSNSVLEVIPPEENTSFYLTTQSAFGCTHVDSFLYQTFTNFVDTVMATNASCFGGADGEIQVLADPGVQARLNGGVWSTNLVFENLSAGNYTVDLKDAMGCEIQKHIQIVDPLELQTGLMRYNNPCFSSDCNGQLAVHPTGGTPPYDFSWSTGGVTDSLWSLCDGVYDLTLTDANGCQVTDQATLASQPALVVDIQTTNSNCQQPSGKLEILNVVGGSQPYSFLWSNGASSQINDDLSAGIYTLTITDSKGCDTVIAPLDVKVINAPKLHVLGGVDTSICYGANLQVEALVVDGTFPFSYHWNTGHTANTYQIEGQVSNCYSLYIEDADGCVSETKSFCVDVYDQIQTQDTVLLAVCEQQNIQLQTAASGGHPDSTLVYQWLHESLNDPVINIQANQSFPTEEIYEVAIHDGGCSEPDTQHFVLNYYPKNTFDFSSDIQSGCAPLEVQFTSDSESNSCFWLVEDQVSVGGCDGVSYTYHNSGIFDVSLVQEYGNGCLDTLTKTTFIEVFDAPDIHFTSWPDDNELSVLDPVVDFENTSDMSLGTFEWTLFTQNATDTLYNSFEDHPHVDFSPYLNPSNLDQNIIDLANQNAFVMQLSLITTDNCDVTVSKPIEFIHSSAVFVPDAFTPNQDGINDLFKPYGHGILTNCYYTFRVFSSWGNLIFETSDYTQGWDGLDSKGDMVPQGTYRWTLTYRTIDQQEVKESGFVILHRF